MITHHNGTASERIKQRIGLYVIVLLSVSWMALFAILDGNVLGMGGLYAVPVLLTIAYIAHDTLEQFGAGRIYDSYLLSSATLAIINPKRPTRYLKPRDLVAYRPYSKQFVMRDGSLLKMVGLAKVHSKNVLDEQIIANWFGDEVWRQCVKERLSLLTPPSNVGIGRVSLVTLAITGGLYGAFQGREALSTLCLIVLLPALMLRSPTEILAARRVEIQLDSEPSRSQ